MPDDDLRTGEFELTEDRELVWRQIHPSFVHDGRVSSQAFTPTPKDAGELSVTRSSLVDAQDTFEHYTETLGHPSVGVYSVTVGEVTQEGLRTVDDSNVSDGEIRPPAHAYIDFKAVSGKAAKRVGGGLRAKAEARGWAHDTGTATT